MVCCILHHVPLQGGKLCSIRSAVSMVLYFLVFLCIHERLFSRNCAGEKWTHVSCLLSTTKLFLGSQESPLSEVQRASSARCALLLKILSWTWCMSSSRLGGIYRRWLWKLTHSLLEVSRDFHSMSSVVGLHLWRKKTSCIMLISFLPWHFSVTDLSRQWSSEGYLPRAVPTCQSFLTSLHPMLERNIWARHRTPAVCICGCI
jgi:hypothetical protein